MSVDTRRRGSATKHRHDADASKVGSVSTGSARVHWIDAAKGVGISLVVFGHVERGLVAANILDPNSWKLVDYFLYAFHMPLFMLLAGLNVPNSIGKPKFLQRKALAIVVPYFVWSLIQGSVMAVLSRYTNSGGDWHRLTEILYSPISPFWFLYVLFFYIIAIRVLAPSWALLIAAVLGLAFSPLIHQPLLFQIAYFFPYFVLGCLISRKVPQLNAISGTVSAVFFIVWAGFAETKGVDYYSPYVVPASLAGIIFSIAVSQTVGGFSWIRRLGQMSLPIYVMHILAAASTRIALTKILKIHNGSVHLALGVAIGIIAPCLVFLILRRLKLEKYLGFGTAPRQKVDL